MKYSDVKITLVSVLVFRLGSSRSTFVFLRAWSEQRHEGEQKSRLGRSSPLVLGWLSCEDVVAGVKDELLNQSNSWWTRLSRTIVLCCSVLSA